MDSDAKGKRCRCAGRLVGIVCIADKDRILNYLGKNELGKSCRVRETLACSPT
jgi:hypothetical protein